MKNKKQKFKLIKQIIIYFITMTLVLTISLKYQNYKNNKYHPETIKEGTTPYLFGNNGIYDVEDKGLDELIEIFNKTDKRQNDKTNISYLKIELNKNGTLKELQVSLNYFNDKLEWSGTGYYFYKDKTIEYNYSSLKNCEDITLCNIQSSIVEKYQKSLNIEYINEKLKQIPLKKQIKLSNLKFYILEFSSAPLISNEATSVFDLRNNNKIEALSLEDYKKGLGGKTDNDSYLMITLSDSSSSTADEIYKYIFDYIDGDTLQVGYNMETDYIINNGSLKFTRDYGISYIDTDLTEKELNETLSFYRSNSLLFHSWTINTNNLIPVAYFYGEDAKLKISKDNGLTWHTKEFTLETSLYPKPVTKRIVRFIDENIGYVALGTDWTMGTGELKSAFITYDKGDTWNKINLPEEGTRKTLKDFYMYNEKVSILLLHDPDGNGFPILYSTLDGGLTWNKINYNISEIPENIKYITSIEKIEYIDNEYKLKFGQRESSNFKITFKSDDLINIKYTDQTRENIHTIG